MFVCRRCKYHGSLDLDRYINLDSIRGRGPRYLAPGMEKILDVIYIIFYIILFSFLFSSRLPSFRSVINPSRCSLFSGPTVSTSSPRPWQPFPPRQGMFPAFSSPGPRTRFFLLCTAGRWGQIGQENTRGEGVHPRSSVRGCGSTGSSLRAHQEPLLCRLHAMVAFPLHAQRKNPSPASETAA